MARPIQHNTQFDPNARWVWEVEFYDDDSVPENISAYAFSFVLKNASGATIWNVTDGEFTRIKNYAISFEKSQPTIQALPQGVYSYSFKVTNGDVTDDEWIYGKIIR